MSPMKRSSYRERDYAFGQMMLTLRTTIGLTQAGLANLLGVSQRAVAEWEGGSSYPKAEHLKTFIELCVQGSAFAAGREEEQIRALWKAAHQKVLLDGNWLHELLSTQHHQPSPMALPPGERALSSAPSAPGPWLDWGEALIVPSFYGRKKEIATLEQWVVQDRCQVVSVLGLGGIGKSALAVEAMQQVAPHFEVVVFRSLRDAPPCEALLEDCLQVLAPEPLANVPAGLEERLRLLLGFLRNKRALLVLDNLDRKSVV